MKRNNTVPINVVLTVGAFVAVFMFFSLLNRSFFRWNNIVAILMRGTILVPLSIGVMLSLIVRVIDLSSGTTVGLLGVVLTMLIRDGISLPWAIVVIAFAGIAIGLVNGTLIGVLNMNPFIATLAVMFIGNSIERVLTQGGLPIYLYGDTSGLAEVFRGVAAGVPIPIVLLACVSIATYITLEKTVFGRRLYATGSSIGGATNAGIPVRRYYVAAYAVSSLLAVLSAVLVASQVRSGQPMVGQSYLWDAIGAAFLSTIISKKRRPNVAGTVFGVAFLAMVTNGLTILGIAFYWMDFFRGLIILFMLLSSVITIRDSKRRVTIGAS
ncbi:MAG: ABC transporter permease [Spirochaetales bacterium]|nr:ABC transporter permease [Spirochaetales bacterium]